MSDGTLKHSRARSGGAAAAASPKRYAPLREVTAAGLGCETLECGHEIRTPTDMVGETSAYRRRCLDCLRESCSHAGHPFDIERGVPSCRCGVSDDAVRHLLGWHGFDLKIDKPLSNLAEARRWHELVPERRTHYHWHGNEWQVRTRPEHGLAG